MPTTASWRRSAPCTRTNSARAPRGCWRRTAPTSCFLRPAGGAATGAGRGGRAEQRQPADGDAIPPRRFRRAAHVSAPAGLVTRGMMTLPNGLTVVLVPRPQFPSVTALLGFHGGSAALPPGVLEMVRVVEAHLHKRHPTELEVLRADGRGFTADFVRTDRRRLSNALYSLADRLKTVAATDWQGLLARAQATATPEDLRSHDGREWWRRAGCWRRSTAAIRTGTGSAARICWRCDPSLAPQWLPYLYNPRNALSRHRRRHRRQRRGLAGIGLVRELARSGRHGTPDGASRRPARHPGHPREGADHASPGREPGRGRLRLPSSRSRRPAASGRRNACWRIFSVATFRRRSASRRAPRIRWSGSVSALPAGGAHLTVAMSVDTRRLREALRVLHAELDALGAGRIEKGAVSQARWALATEDALDYQTGLKATSQILEAFSLGLPLEALSTDADELAHVERKGPGPCLRPVRLVARAVPDRRRKDDPRRDVTPIPSSRDSGERCRPQTNPRRSAPPSSCRRRRSRRRARPRSGSACRHRW